MSTSHRFPGGSRRGWLRSDSLRQGYAEQQAVIVDGVTHSVALVHDERRGGFVATYRVDDPKKSIVEVREFRTSDDLTLARAKFAGFVREMTALTPA